jgi:hypothetical protein
MVVVAFSELASGNWGSRAGTFGVLFGVVLLVVATRALRRPR